MSQQQRLSLKLRFIIFSFTISARWMSERHWKSENNENIFAILKAIKYFCRPVEVARVEKKITNCWDYSRVLTVYSFSGQWHRGNNFHKAQQERERKEKGSEGKMIPKEENILFNRRDIWKILSIYLSCRYRSCFSFLGFRLCHEAFCSSLCVVRK